VSYVTSTFDERALEIVRRGGVGLVPSDTIYGLSCAALNEQAVLKLHKLKDRSGTKPFIILISDLEMLDLLSINISNLGAVADYWPGPLTAIFPAESAPSWLHLGLKTLAVRMPNQADLKEFISKTGPLISTSANLEGQPPVGSSDDAKQLFGEQLDFYIDKGRLNNQEPSTIVSIVEGQLKVIRQGKLKIKGEQK
jgi:L-threonylcarbamoyladenylate synthase